ncbi:hypothetical protein GGTG_05033 [Gaeumannomyces tritici R3-111a-1]|uniref:Zn(2)-C6 fungal-type domain-containing protein n=1 Tax=Gaeumannomyces tritici (strain R3-111a-1) TaxID=644352 RepID=J3NUS7_GAET3|nr:hypothetical protein GGTG_05033 [Gaeumannomyces tritici R3-111a-1]EJT79951.1 hypothetical protein GGTG_05033 [Gaeumannomyces tritici R3-111a-1]
MTSSSSSFGLGESQSRSTRSSASAVATASAGVPAPYGRACTNCSKAKCRCVYRGSGADTGACERCHRLAKQCVPSETVRKRTPRRHIVSRTAQLEEKLDDLVSLLKTQRQAKEGAGSASTREAPSALPQARPSCTARGRLPRFSDQIAPNIPSPPSSHDAEPRPLLSVQPDKATPSPQPTPTPSSTSPPGSADLVEAERSLDAFRSRFIRFFPFMHIPVSMTAQNLSRKRPLTMLAIRCVTSRSYEKQQKLSDELRELISDKAVVHYESSLDILLAILAFAGWAHFHKRDRPYMTLFTRLATAQLIELGLHRPFGELPAPRFWKDSEAKSFMADQLRGAGPTNEERRAALGCFCLCAMTSSTMRRFDPLRWTPFMEEMLRDLEKNPECEGDKVLVVQVKAEQLVEQIHNARQGSDGSIARPGLFESACGIEDPSKGLPHYVVKLFRSRLKDLISSIPEELLKHDAVEPMMHSLDLMVNECAVNKSPRMLQPLNVDMPDPNPSSLAANPQQLEYLHGCVDALERYFSRIFAMAAVFYHGFSFAMCTRMTHALVALFRLTVYDDPLWDRAALRRRLDVLAMIDGTTARVMDLKMSAGLDEGEDGEKAAEGAMPTIFLKSWTFLERMRAGWEVEIKNMDAAAQGGMDAGEGVSPSSSSLATLGGPGTGGVVAGGGNVALLGGQLPPQLMMGGMDMQQQQQPQAGPYGQYDLNGTPVSLGVAGPVDQAWISDVFYPWDYQTMAMNWANI